jgi:hypothetical protein
MTKLFKIMEHIFMYTPKELLKYEDFSFFEEFILREQKNLPKYVNKLLQFDFRQFEWTPSSSFEDTGEKSKEEAEYTTHSDKIFDHVTISEGIMIKIYKSLSQNMDALSSPKLINSIETLNYLEDSDEIFQMRIEEHKSKIKLSPILNKTLDNSKDYHRSCLLDT